MRLVIRVVVSLLAACAALAVAYFNYFPRPVADDPVPAIRREILPPVTARPRASVMPIAKQEQIEPVVPPRPPFLRVQPRSNVKLTRGKPVDSSQLSPTTVQPSPVETEITSKIHVCVFSREGDRIKSAKISCAPYDREDGVSEGTIIASAVTDGKGEADMDITSSHRAYFVLTAECEGQSASTLVGVWRKLPSRRVDLVLHTAAALQGRVVTSTGEPIEEVRVSCLLVPELRFIEPIWRVVHSDSDGRFTFASLPRAPHIVRADAPEFAPALSKPTVPGEPPITLVMDKGGSMNAAIKDKVSGNPVADVEVMLSMKLKEFVKFLGRSNSEGVISIQGMTPGEYDLCSTSDAFTLLPPRQTLRIVLDKTTQTEFLVEPTSAISGMVVDSTTGAGIADVTLVARSVEVNPNSIYAGAYGPPVRSKDFITDQAGVFSIVGLPSGDYYVNLGSLPPVYGPHARSALPTTISIQAGELIDDLVFELSIGITLRGLVVNADGTAAPGASVYAWMKDPTVHVTRWSEYAYSDTDGSFVFGDCLEGQPIFVQASLDARRSPEIGPLELTASGMEGVTIELEDVKTSSIAGRVVNLAGKPVSYQVHARRVESEDVWQPRSYLATTDSDGYFLITEAVVGEYEFSVRTPTMNVGGYLKAREARPRTLREPEPLATQTLDENHSIRDLRLVVPETGISISGTVVDAEGVPAVHYFVEAERLLENRIERYGDAMTDTFGEFVFQNIDEGRYKLRNPRGKPEEWSVEVNTGDNVKIVLPPETPRPE